jgi:hypothetical protein
MSATVYAEMRDPPARHGPSFSDTQTVVGRICVSEMRGTGVSENVGFYRTRSHHLWSKPLFCLTIVPLVFRYTASARTMALGRLRGPPAACVARNSGGAHGRHIYVSGFCACLFYVACITLVMLAYLGIGEGKKTGGDILPGEETPTESPTETPIGKPGLMNIPPPNVSWTSAGAVSMGPVGSLMGPVDASAIAPTWTNATGFTGTPVVSNAETRIFGNIMGYTFLVSGLTAAAGNNTATITVPHGVVGGTFTRNYQGGAQVSGSNATSGQAFLGNARVSVGTANLTVSLFNGDADPLAMDGGISVFCLYCLV